MFDSREKFLSLLDNLPLPSAQFQELARARQLSLTKPNGALGRLEEITIWLSGWQQQERLSVSSIEALLFAGNHGVVAENISPFPQSVTAQMVANFEAGGAAINALTTAFDHGLKVFPIELDRPTMNFVLEPAMSVSDTLDAMNVGAGAVNSCEADLIYFGEMGIGNTTSAAAIACAVFGGVGADWAGPGTGLSKDGVQHKGVVIDRAIKQHLRQYETAFDVMRIFGGRELAAIMGGVVAARLRSLPVLLDGFVVTAAVSALAFSGYEVFDHCLAAHCSAEPSHRRLLDRLWLSPLLDLNMRLGEGTGAALAAELVKGAVSTYNSMATFDQAAVDEKN